MVHNRYIVKNGKRYGPYIYKSYRTKGGKVKNAYLGKKRAFLGSKLIQRIFFSILVLSAFLFAVKYAYSFNSVVQGTANLTIWDDTDNLTKRSNDMVYFYSNYTIDSSGESINSSTGECNITFNTSSGWDGEIFNMSFSDATLQYEYNISFDTQGSFQFNVSCYNESLALVSLTDAFVITNTLPTINTPLAIQACTEDVACTYNFSADVSDVDVNDTLVYGYDAGSPVFSGFSIDTSTGIVTVNITIEGQANEVESAKLTVVDPSGDGGVATKNFTITFVNDTPAMVIPSNPLECNEDSECSMQISATDEENDTFFFESNNTLFPIGAESGLINSTINNSFVGSYWVNISVNDSSDKTMSSDINITVFNVNDAPVLDYVCGDAVSATEDLLFECEVNATDDDFDYGDNLTFSANETWVVIDSNGSNATVSFTANDTQVDFWWVNFTVSDTSNVTSSRLVNINVTNVSDAPLLTAMGELSAFTGIPFYYDVNATDEDLFIPNTGEVLYFSINDTSLFTINSTSGEFSFTPSQDNIGEWWINFTVNDTDGTPSSELVNLTVYNNTAPDFNMSLELSYTEDDSLVLNLSDNASDAEGDSISFSSNNSLFVVNSTTGVIDIVVNDSFVGENWVNFSATDSNGALASLAVNITVNNVNDLPNFTENLNNYSIDEDSEFYLQVNGSDEDLFIPSGNVFGISESLVFSVNDTSVFTISSGGLIDFTPTNLQVGEYWFNISVLDNTSNSYSEEVNITILSVDDRPYFTNISNITGSQDNLIYLDINATDEEDGSDSDSSNLTFWINTTAFDPDSTTSVINSTTGIIEFTSNSSHVGTHSINVSVNDSSGLSTSMDIIMDINSTNNLPSITSCTVTGFTCDAPCSCSQIVMYENSSNTTFTVYTQDLDDESLYYEWYVDGVFNASGSGTDSGVNTGSDNIVYLPGFLDSGEHNVSVFINDTYNTTATEWNVSVLNFNSPPTFDTTIQNISWNQDTDYSNLDLDSYFTDLENQTDLAFTWTQYDSSLSEINSSSSKVNVSVSSSHVITLSPTAAWSGNEYVVFHANDTEDNVSSNSVMLNVTAVTSSATTSSGTGGGGGGGGGGTKLTSPVAIDIIHSSDLSFIKGKQVISPIKIKNTNSDLILYDIGLSVVSNTDFIKAQLDRSFIKSLLPLQEEEVNLILEGTDAGMGEVSVTASVVTPQFKDSAKFFVNVIPLNLSDVEQRVKFVKDLFKENPECLDLNEVVFRAEKALSEEKYADATSLLEVAISKCKDLITHKEKEKPLTPLKRMSAQRILLLAALNVVALTLAYIVVRKKVRERRLKEENG